MSDKKQIIELDGGPYEVFEIERIENPRGGITHCAHLRPVPKPLHEVWIVVGPHNNYMAGPYSCLENAKGILEDPYYRSARIAHMREVPKGEE